MTGLIILGLFLGLILLAYLGYCFSLYLKQTELLYSPVKETLHDNHSQMFSHLPHQGWLIQSAQPSSHALLYFGGKGEAIEHRARELARWFPKHHIYLIPYRGYGPNRTMIPQEKDLKSDALSFFDAISQEHSHIDVIGRSMGTTIALFLAKYRPVRRLSLITPYYSISQLAQHRYPWVPVRWLLKDKFDAWKYAHALQTPLLAVISITDRIIPMEQWERLKKLMTQPIEEFFIEDDHDLLLESEELWSKLANFFEFDTIST